MYPQVLLQNRKPDRIATLAEYEESGGYSALRQVMPQAKTGFKDLLPVIQDALLLGRGGAGFPAGVKLSTVAEDAPFPRYLVCNADEMEPGTFKDRILIHADPHQLIEGMTLTACAFRAELGIIFIRPEYESAARILEREIELAVQAGYLGTDILGSGFNFNIDVHRSGGRYICGEGTAQLNALEGRRPTPRKPPPYPTERGLWQQPTVVHNVETLCCVSHIVRHGAQWFKDLALTEDGAGTKLYVISGRVKRPGCYELPMGIKLSDIIETHCLGMSGKAPFKACLPGGASTGFLPAEHYDIEMDFEGLKAVGNRLGTAAIMVFDEDTCLLRATVNLMNFFARESCGWCTPCREGIPYLRELLQQIEVGEGEMGYIDTIGEMADRLWHAYCAFAPGAAGPVQSLVALYRDELEEHIRLGHCPFPHWTAGK